MFGNGHFQRAGSLGCLPLADFTYNRLSILGTTLGEWVATSLSGQITPGTLKSVIERGAAYLIVPLITLIGVLQPHTVYLGGVPSAVTAGLSRQLDVLKDKLLPSQLTAVSIAPISDSDEESVIGAASLPFMYGLFLAGGPVPDVERSPGGTV